MNRFHHNQSLKESSLITLCESESFHLKNVLRLCVGEKIRLFNGQNEASDGEIREINKKSVIVQVFNVRKISLPSPIQLVFGIPKSKTIDFIFHRCTEVGLESYQPLITKHSTAMGQWNEERWKKVLIEVCKQCEQDYVPLVHAPIAFETWVNQRDRNRLLVFCDEKNRHTSLTFTEDLPCGFDLLVGPEGGFSEFERSFLLNQNAFTLGLGSNRLRTETAALVALSLLNHSIRKDSLI